MHKKLEDDKGKCITRSPLYKGRESQEHITANDKEDAVSIVTASAVTGRERNDTVLDAILVVDD